MSLSYFVAMNTGSVC